MMFKFIFIALFIGGYVWAESAPMYDLTPSQEVRFQQLLKEFRCLVCQNQSLAESSASLAGDLKDEILNMVRDDKPDEVIYAFMTDRYGDYVLYRPPVKSKTLLLWAMPLLLLVAVAAGVLLYLRRQRVAARPGDQ